MWERTISREKNPELAQLIDILDFPPLSHSRSLTALMSDYLCLREQKIYKNGSERDINVHYGVNIAYSHMVYVLISHTHKCVVHKPEQ